MKLNLDIDMQSNVPIYIQIANQIRHKIAAEELRPGDQLPTVRQVAADLRVNFNTVARAYRLLDEAGVIDGHALRGHIQDKGENVCRVRVCGCHMVYIHLAFRCREGRG